MARSSGSPHRHVVPSDKGGWDVKRPGSSRASAHSPTQDAAVRRAREIVQRGGGGKVRIHGRDGRIRDSAMIATGSDPRSSRDTR